MLTLTLSLVVPAPATPAEDPPNIILILADDLGWTDVSGGRMNLGHGSDFYETPHLDRLAAEGMAFPHAYAAGANCSPTRAALMSGQYAPRTGVYTVGSLDRTGRGPEPPLRGIATRPDLSAETVTMAERLQGRGYATCHIGKYHVGGQKGTRGTTPSEQGFDENFGGGPAGHAGRSFADASGRFGPRVGPELDAFARPGTHLTDAVTDAAIDFMGRHADRPFFVQLAHYAVHTPIRGQGRPDLVARFRSRGAPASEHRDADYAALVAGIDESLGRVRRFLSETRDGRGRRLSARTLIIVTSDNGGLTGPAGVTANTPLKGQKGEYHEGGIRVPLVFWYPARIPAGGICHEPVTTVDLLPTVLGVAGIAAATDEVIDGSDLAPLLRDPTATLGRDGIFWHFPGYLRQSGRDARPVSIIRRGRWKLVYRYEETRCALFDLRADPGEATDRADDEPAVTTSLRTRLAAWLDDVGGLPPVHRDSGRPAAGP